MSSTQTSSPLVAVLGLGTMGAPMAKTLLSKGFRVRVHNRTREREVPLAALSAERAENPAAAVSLADFVLVCVTDAPDVESVLFREPDGAIFGLTPGAIVIDTSTIAPEATRDFAARLEARGGHWIDAPVSGGPEGAAAGTLSLMCGGRAADIARARPILEAIGKTVTHVGPVSAGQLTKAVNQIAIAGTYQALAEGLAFAARAGVDPAKVLAAISGGAARSWVLENRGENMLRDRYPLGFKLAHHRKDLAIALESAKSSGAALPLTELVLREEDQALDQGFGDEDVSVLARLARQRNGLPLGPFGQEASGASHARTPD